MRRIRYSFVAVMLVATLATLACSEGPRSVSPVAPSQPGSIATQETTAMPSGFSAVKIGSRWSAQSGLAVEGTDVITALTGSCPSIVVTIQNVPVTINASTVFGTGTTCAGLAVNTNVHVTGLLTFGLGGAVSVVATNVSVVVVTPETITGTIASVSGSCPSVTVTLTGLGGIIVTSPTTTFTPTGSCSTLAAGQSIEGIGTRNSTLQLAATSFSVLTSTSVTTTVTGTIASLSGSCPSKTVTLTGLGGVVVTGATTTFTPTGSCATLATGQSIEATGTRNTSQQLVATSFGVVTTTATPETVTGSIASLSGSCPAKTLTLEGVGGVIVTSSATTFTTGSCAALAVGVGVEATGTRNATQQLLATALDVEDDVSAGVPVGHGHHVGGQATAGHVRGTCPALSMVLRGVHLTTTSATTFLDGTCSAIRNGTKLTVMGVTQTDGSVTATSVRIGKQPGKK